MVLGTKTLFQINGCNHANVEVALVKKRNYLPHAAETLFSGNGIIPVCSFLLATALLLGACGGGNSNVVLSSPASGSSNLPPAPDPSVNNSTLSGVDANNNGIRDDVERQIVGTFSSDSSAASLHLKSARSLQAALVSPSVAAKTAYVDSFRCVDDTAILNKMNTFVHLTLNTDERRRAYAIVFAGIQVTQEGC